MSFFLWLLHWVIHNSRLGSENWTNKTDIHWLYPQQGALSPLKLFKLRNPRQALLPITYLWQIKLHVKCPLSASLVLGINTLSNNYMHRLKCATHCDRALADSYHFLHTSSHILNSFFPIIPQVDACLSGCRKSGRQQMVWWKEVCVCVCVRARACAHMSAGDR